MDVNRWQLGLSYVAQAGQALYGEGTAAFTQGFTSQRQAFHYGVPEEVLRALQRWAATAQRRQADSAAATVRVSLSYLAKRRGMLDYAWVQVWGYPLGSGRVESANNMNFD
jgi:hypothetical protein